MVRFRFRVRVRFRVQYGGRVRLGFMVRDRVCLSVGLVSMAP